MKGLDEGHIPQIATILYYSERDSFLHRASPWTKFAGLVVFVVAATVLNSISILAVAYLFSLFIYSLGELPMKKLMKWSLFPVIFVLTISFLLVFEEPGHVLFSAFGIRLTDGGLLLVAKLLLKGLAVVNFSIAFIMSTRYSSLSRLAERILPWPFDVIFMLTFHFIFVVFDVVDTALLAVWARGGGLRKGFLSMTSLYSQIFALGVLYSFDKAERVGKAMEARGFSGRLKSYAPMSTPSAEGIAAIALSALLLIVIYVIQGAFP